MKRELREIWPQKQRIGKLCGTQLTVNIDANKVKSQEICHERWIYAASLCNGWLAGPKFRIETNLPRKNPFPSSSLRFCLMIGSIAISNKKKTWNDTIFAQKTFDFSFDVCLFISCIRCWSHWCTAIHGRWILAKLFSGINRAWIYRIFSFLCLHRFRFDFEWLIEVLTVGWRTRKPIWNSDGTRQFRLIITNGRSFAHESSWKFQFSTLVATRLGHVGFHDNFNYNKVFFLPNFRRMSFNNLLLNVNDNQNLS